MKNEQSVENFRKSVKTKFQIYNSLFMSLPYENMLDIGMLIPFLYQESKKGYSEGKTPVEIIDNFFTQHTHFKTEKDRLEMLFIFIQYIERQVVLFDSIEDAAFAKLHSEADAGTINHLYERSLQENKMDEVRNKLDDFAVRVVFTAHPTQFYPNSVQRILHDLRTAIMEDSVQQIDTLLRQLGKTPFVNKTKPSPLDEALSIIYYLRYVYYDSIGELYKKLKNNFDSDCFVTNPNSIQLGFWPGGDRDGNPFVTADITEKVASELRISVLKCYYSHLKFVRRRLSFRNVAEVLTELSDALYGNIFHGKPELSCESIIEKIDLAEQILIEQHHGLFREILVDFRDRVRIFGTHFATLDIRQDSRIHQNVVDEIFNTCSGKSADMVSSEEKINFLLSFKEKLNPEDFEGITKESLKTIYSIKKIQQTNGERGLHRYIISNSENIKDVLNVYVLFIVCGYSIDEINIDIVPLFETIEGLNESSKVMTELYQNLIYRKHLEKRNFKQNIMLGFSDGTKDGGYLKANWEIFQTKENLSKISNQHNIKVIFFDGRGGPPARGGGKTHDFYASQGKNIANHKIEITIQGQTITSVFGNKDQAKYNFEQLLTAGIENEVFTNTKNDLNTEGRELISELASLSFKKYTELKEHPRFIPYLQEMSTLQYYGRTNIGSRPSKRSSENQLKFEDLRAIPFVGSWALLKQNVPGFYGFGHALNALKHEGKLEAIKALYKNSNFFKTLVLNSMMSMNKSYFPLTGYMSKDTKFGEFWNLLHNEYQLSKQLMLELTGYEILQQEEPISRKSVNIREKIVLPLLSIQQYALMKIQEGSKDTELYEKLVIRSLFGNINASRNSA